MGTHSLRSNYSLPALNGFKSCLYIFYFIFWIIKKRINEIRQKKQNLSLKFWRRKKSWTIVVSTDSFNKFVQTEQRSNLSKRFYWRIYFFFPLHETKLCIMWSNMFVSLCVITLLCMIIVMMRALSIGYSRRNEYISHWLYCYIETLWIRDKYRKLTLEAKGKRMIDNNL